MPVDRQGGEAAERPLLAEDNEPIKAVSEAERKAWERKPSGYSRDQFEADRAVHSSGSAARPTASEQEAYMRGFRAAKAGLAAKPEGESGSAAQPRKRYIVDWAENGDPILLDPSVGPPHPVVGTHDLPAPSGSAVQKQEEPCGECEMTDGHAAWCSLGRAEAARSPQGEDHEAGTWRVGRKVGRTIYRQRGDEPSDDDELIGVMDTPYLAKRAVESRNRTAYLSRCSSPERDTRAETALEDARETAAGLYGELRAARAETIAEIVAWLRKRAAGFDVYDAPTAHVQSAVLNAADDLLAEFGPARAQEPQEEKR